MVLISHKHKFIFFKTLKTAGSSVESFFGRYCCDPNDKYEYTDEIDEKISKYGVIGGRLRGKHTKWYSHKKAVNIKRDMNKDRFKDYFKFTIVRNPWDKMVSQYYWLNKKVPFKQFIKNNRDKFRDENWNIYSINDTPVCDYYIRYENLEEDIKKVCELVGITDYDLNLLPKHKSGIRDNSKHWRDHYDEETKKIVFEDNLKEILYFKYRFNE